LLRDVIVMSQYIGPVKTISLIYSMLELL